MTVYKVSDEFAKIKSFSGIIFDCDGVLIDSSCSYDKGLVTSAGCFASLLGLAFDQQEYLEAIEEIRKLGTFNNDWDSLAVTLAFLYSKSKDRKVLDEIAQIEPLSHRLRSFESEAVSRENIQRAATSFSDLKKTISRVKQGTKRDELIMEILG
ncbi:MAG: hypothetical protein ACREBS_00370, partial [Nitrososphaerales archaeon]